MGKAKTKKFTFVDSWVAQQSRHATPFGQPPQFLIWPRDSKYRQTFARDPVDSSIDLLKKPYHVSKAVQALYLVNESSKMIANY